MAIDTGSGRSRTVLGMVESGRLQAPCRPRAGCLAPPLLLLGNRVRVTRSPCVSREAVNQDLHVK